MKKWGAAFSAEQGRVGVLDQSLHPPAHPCSRPNSLHTLCVRHRVEMKDAVCRYAWTVPSPVRKIVVHSEELAQGAHADT